MLLMVPVKLPKEVLDLFPLWEHRCPCCGTYVESNTSFCPNCKTAFDEKGWRVAPRFLKSHEAMSEYAHKVLAPKLTPEQRELLFQYFTEFFSDGFESGDFSAWSGTTATTGETVSVVTSDKHHGNYSFYGASNGGGGGETACAYVTHAGISTIYVRAYMKYVTIGQPDNNDRFFNIICRGTGGNYMCEAGVINVSGTKRFKLITRNGTGYASSTDSTIAVQTGQWYCFEMYWKQDAVNGEAKLYIDGVELCSASGLDSTAYGAVTKVDFGFGSIIDCASCEAYFDCVVVADTYIGPETTTQTYTRTWTTDALLKKLGITKTLDVDAVFQKQNIQKTFSLDSTFQKSFTIQKQVDALFKKPGIHETFGVDVGFLKRNVVKSFAVDTRFGALTAQSMAWQIDAVLKKLDATKDFGLDACFGADESETYTITFGLSAIFAYNVRLPELWLTEEGKIVLNISKPYAWVGT